jgi:4-coumarate--CoA ligase
MVQTDNTLYDFMLGSKYERSDQPWFIDALSGETRTAASVKERTDALALGLQASLSQDLNYNNTLNSSTITTDLPYAVRPVISLISPNDIDYGTCVWASHKLGCTVAPSNAGSTVDELTYQLRLSGATAIIAHPNTLAKVLTAARVVGISVENIFVLARGQVANLDEQIKAWVYGISCFFTSLTNLNMFIDLLYTRRITPK